MPKRRAVGVATANRFDARSTEAVSAARRLVGLAQHQMADGALALDCFRRQLDEVAVVATLPAGSLRVREPVAALAVQPLQEGRAVRLEHVDSTSEFSKTRQYRKRQGRRSGAAVLSVVVLR